MVQESTQVAPGLHRYSYTPQDDQLLTELKEKGLSWPEIAEHFPGRTPKSLEARYYSVTQWMTETHRAQRQGGHRWTPAQDRLLIELREEKRLPWGKIVESFPNRSRGSVQVRYDLLKKSENTPPPARKKHHIYTPAEDQLLIELRDEAGLSWNQIVKSFPERSVAALRLRYVMLKRKTTVPFQAPRQRGPPFTPADDQLLIELKEEQGLTWNQINKAFPGRSRGTLQLRYQRIKKKRKTTL